MKAEQGFWKLLRAFFTVYLPKQRNVSMNTIISCQQTWNLLLRYLNNIRGFPLQDISMETFDADMVVSFLDCMELEKGWKPSTRNQRLSMIRSFFTYATCMAPMNYIYSSRLEAIPLKKDTNKSFVLEYMSKTAVKALLAAPDSNSRLGIRDQFFMSLMYDSAARDNEMLTLKVSDLVAETSTVYLLGKGDKPRLVPISKETVEYFSYYKRQFHNEDEPSAPMFYTKHKGMKTVMSDDNVARFMKKYADIARGECNEIPENVHPHLLRKSRAMHLYQGGMPLSVLSEFLGHSDPETTLIYARADMNMKREAVAKAEKRNPGTPVHNETPVWDGNDDIIEKLCRGYG